MSQNKKIKNQSVDLDMEKSIMSQINSEQISMKPQWYFVVGSFLMMTGLIALSIVSVFFTNIILFSLRSNNCFNTIRLDMMIESFPWWMPILAIVGIMGGLLLLKKYDLSYKKNFILIAFMFIVSILVVAWFIDYSGLNEVWSRRVPMRRFYQHLKMEPGNSKLDFEPMANNFRKIQYSNCYVN